MKAKLREMDFLRAVAALAVIAIHVTSSQYYTNKFAFVWDTAVSFAVPVFIIVSGYLLHYSNKDKIDFSYSGFLKRRLSKVLIPYLIWTVIYMLLPYSHDFKEIFSTEFLESLVKGIFFGRGYVHLYFMAIIIQLYLIYPILRRFIRFNQKYALISAFIINFYFQIYDYMNQHGIKMLPDFGRRYYFIMFTRWIFYFVLGMYIYQNREQVSKVIANIKVELAIVWVMVLTVLLTVSRLYIKGNPIIYPISMMFAISSFFLIYSICYYFRETASKVGTFMEWFSKQSFIVYLSHLILIRLVLKRVPEIIGINVWGGSIGLVLFFVSTVFITTAFAYLVSLTPAAPWLGGAKSGRFSVTNK